MESPRGSEHVFPDSYGAAATPMFRPPVKFHLHRPFEQHVTRRQSDAAVESSFSRCALPPVDSYLQYPDVHSTGFPLLLPAPPTFQQHPALGAFQQLYHHQKMRAVEDVAESKADELELMRSRTDLGRHDNSRGEEDERSGSPDSPTQLTGDEDADDDSASPDNSRQTSSLAANKCESLTNDIVHSPSSVLQN